MAQYPPVHNPMIPYLGPIPGGCQPGTLIQIYGNVPLQSNRFAVNIQCGPNVSPRDDVAFHINADLLHNRIVRNSISQLSWGPEEAHGFMPLARGQPFSYAILCEPTGFKLAINGSHFTEMTHRLPLHRASYLAIDGEVTVTSIQYSGGLAMPQPGHVGFNPPALSSYPSPGHYPGAAAYPSQPSYPAQGTYPGQQASYPVQPGTYGQPMGFGGHNKHSGHPGGGGGPMLGMGATGLGAGLVGATLAHKLSPKKALKSQKKAAKKALKYGVPLAGLGVGAYTVGRILHRSSSSSSSSSD